MLSENAAFRLLKSFWTKIIGKKNTVFSEFCYPKEGRLQHRLHTAGCLIEAKKFPLWYRVTVLTRKLYPICVSWSNRKIIKSQETGTNIYNLCIERLCRGEKIDWDSTDGNCPANDFLFLIDVIDILRRLITLVFLFLCHGAHYFLQKNSVTLIVQLIRVIASLEPSIERINAPIEKKCQRDCRQIRERFFHLTTPFGQIVDNKGNKRNSKLNFRHCSSSVSKMKILNNIIRLN